MIQSMDRNGPGTLKYNNRHENRREPAPDPLPPSYYGS